MPRREPARQALTIPVTQQITDYLGANDDRFNRHQMVFVFAGANDVFFQLGVFAARVNAGMPVQQAQGLALEAMGQAALELAAEVRRIQAHGATRVAVLTVPDIADSIFGRAPEQAAIRPLIAAMVQTFNGTLVAALAGSRGEGHRHLCAVQGRDGQSGQVRRERAQRARMRCRAHRRRHARPGDSMARACSARR